MQKIGAVMCDCNPHRMPDIYEAFKVTVEKYGIEEATRQVEEMTARLAAERAYARKLLIRIFIGGFIIALLIWGTS